MSYPDTLVGEPAGSTATRTLLRSVFTCHWPYTVAVLAYMTLGLVLASVSHGWSWSVFFTGGLMVWFGVEGLHALKLSEEEVDTDTDNGLQRIFGYVELAVGVVFGATLASITTWAFFPFVAVGAALGVIYHESPILGRFRDMEECCGPVDIGVAWAVIPFLGAHFAVAETVSVGVVILSVGVALDAARHLYLFSLSEPAPYSTSGIDYDRDEVSDESVHAAEVYRANTMAVAAMVIGVTGLVIMFGL